MHPVRLAFATVVLALPLPLLAAPCAGFNDVSDTDPFCVYVEWMKNRSITLGLTPTQYDPDSPVTRLQMAAFMYRLGYQNAFLQGGNAFGATAVLGTTDDQPLDVRVNNTRVMRYEPNTISPNVIGGSPANSVAAGIRGATIAGGGVPEGDTDPIYSAGAPNRVLSHYSSVGGGHANVVGDEALPTDSAVATVAGGGGNTASGAASTVSGGFSNTASGHYSTVAGGQYHMASGTLSTVAGGNRNTATGNSSTVAGGSLNEANGHYSFAAGRNAKANGMGSFIWADSQPFDHGSSLANIFAVRATGGVFLSVAINPSTGQPTQYCNLISGTTGWACISDRNVKENFTPVDARAILDRLVAMPLTTWNFKGADPALRMLGPTAQDFGAAFELGSNDDKTIASGNLDGVALAAIQGLNAKLEAEVTALRTEVAELQSVRAELAVIRALLAERITTADARTIGNK